MTAVVGAAYHQHQRLIWGIGYRMLGTAADADEVLQETFVRALEHRPAADRPLRPWLVRVAANLARDRLRRRRRLTYSGPWLPSPLRTDAGTAAAWMPRAPDPDPDARLDLVEDLGYAWLAAAEALTPGQRAVLVLRDVLELSTAETAAALGMRAGNVKTTLHRARRALGPPEAPPTAGDRDAALVVVARLGAALASGDVEAVKAVLADDVVAVSDGGGVYHAARQPVRGADRVARLYLGLVHKDPGVHTELALLNGLPGVLAWWDKPKPGYAPRAALAFAVRGGRIHRIWSVLAPAKLAARH